MANTDNAQAQNDFNTGRTDKVQAPEKNIDMNPAETEQLQERKKNETGSHQEGEYAKQSDRPEMDHDQTNNR